MKMQINQKDILNQLKNLENEKILAGCNYIRRKKNRVEAKFVVRSFLEKSQKLGIWGSAKGVGRKFSRGGRGQRKKYRKLAKNNEKDAHT